MKPTPPPPLPPMPPLPPSPRTGHARRRPRALVAGAILAAVAACGPRATAPAPIGSTPGARTAGAGAPGALELCDAIAVGIAAAPRFTTLAADPAHADPDEDQPATLAVTGAVVTVLLGTDDPDMTISFPGGGVATFDALRPVFLACPSFRDGWQLAEQDEEDRDREDRDHKVRFARDVGDDDDGGDDRDPADDPNLLAWMKVMSNGDVIVVIH